MGGVSPWQKRCDVASGCLHFIGEMIWCGQPQFSTSYGLFSHVKNTQLQVLESLDWAVLCVLEEVTGCFDSLSPVYRGV